MSFSDELTNVNGPARINVEKINRKIEEIAESSKSLKVEREFDHEYESVSQPSEFVEVVTPFWLHCHDQLQLLRKMMYQVAILPTRKLVNILLSTWASIHWKNLFLT